MKPVFVAQLSPAFGNMHAGIYIPHEEIFLLMTGITVGQTGFTFCVNMCAGWSSPSKWIIVVLIKVALLHGYV